MVGHLWVTVRATSAMRGDTKLIVLSLSEKSHFLDLQETSQALHSL